MECMPTIVRINSACQHMCLAGTYATVDSYDKAS